MTVHVPPLTYFPPVPYVPPPVTPGATPPACAHGFTVIAAHVAAGDDGCRPPHCDFGRYADGWCLPPTNSTPPVIYVTGPGDVDEDAATANFLITLSHATTRPVSVTISTADGTANSGSDYTAVYRRVTFPVNVPGTRIAVAVLDDTRDESDETFTLRVSNPSSNAALHATTQAEATIADNDDPPFLGAATNLAAVCVSGQITLSWSPPASGTVNDYRYGIYDNQYLVGGKVAGGTTTQTQITAHAPDPAGTYYAEIQARGGLNPNQAGWLSTGAIVCTQPTPMVSLAAPNLTVGESSSVLITAILDMAPAGTASVRFNASGATNGNGSCSTGADFYTSDTEFTFTNTTTASITLTACDDTDTTDETVTLAFTTIGISGLQLGSPIAVRVTITDDDTSQGGSDGWGL